MARSKVTSRNDDPSRVEYDGNHRAEIEAHAEMIDQITKPIAEAIDQITRPIVLPRLDLRTISIRLIGESPLICHRWSEKAKRAILDKQMGKASTGKQPKDPERDYYDSLYPIEGGGYGFPAIAFKAAAVSACTSLGKNIVSKVQARQCFHIMGELVVIEGEPSMREDMVRVGMGTADIRYRGEFKEWSCSLSIRYNARVLTDEQIVNLFNTAGFAVGVGEWRPEKDGMYGRFRVA